MLRPGLETVEELLGGSRPRDGSGESDLFSHRGDGSSKRHQTYRLEIGDGLALPTVIVPQDGDAEDLFATIATYYQEQSPITAMVHVLSKATMHLFQATAHATRLEFSRVDQAFRRACLGGALGEATLAGMSVADGVAASYAVCRRTLAFSLCRTELLYGSDVQPSVVAARWARLRRLGGLSVSSAAEEVVLLAHAHARPSVEVAKSAVQREMSEAVHAFTTGEDREGARLFATLKELYPEVDAHIVGLRGAFDGRMVAFFKLAELIRNSSHGVRTNEIAVAFLCNQILPGSFAHAGALARLVEIYPAALIWYGVFSASRWDPDSQEPRSGLMDKLERDLLESFSFEQRPSCDISFEELEVLLRSSLRPESIRPTQKRVVLVGLFPGVDLFTRLGSDADAVSEQVRHEIEEDMRRRVTDLLEQALFALKKPLDSRLNLPPAHRRHRKDR